MMYDHLLEAANSIVFKLSSDDMKRMMVDMDHAIGGSWDTPRARLYLATRMAEFERSLKVANVKIKLLEALRDR